jgi:DNA mismatch repair protein MutS2
VTVAREDSELVSPPVAVAAASVGRAGGVSVLAPWASLDWPDLVVRLAGEAQSDVGRALCLELARPSALAGTPDEARRRGDLVAEAAAALGAGRSFPGLAFIDVGPTLDAAARGEVLGWVELRPVAELCDVAGDARRFFRALHPEAAPGGARDVGGDHPSASASASAAWFLTPLLAEWVEPVEPCAALGRKIRATFDASGQVRDDVSPELGRLRREREATSSRVRSEIERLMQDEAWGGLLQDRFWTIRQDRYVLPLKASAKSMGLGIVHDSSRTGETVFVEPASVVELNNRVKLCDLHIEHELRRILEELSSEVASAAPALRDDLEVLGGLDRISAMARLGVAYRGSPGILVDDTFVDLRQARHPLLVLRAAAERGFTVVPNEVVLGDGAARVLVISGPNAGGKTVYLKTLGLAALMVRAGMLVPAEPGSRIGFFDHVLPDIGDRQSVMGDLSTFSAHLANLGHILRVAETSAASGGARSLVLLDELMAGTNPDQGGALARATLEALADLGERVLAVATTHADVLKAVAETDPRFENAGMEYDAAGLAPTFRVRVGVPGRSYALDIATRMGLPPGVLARARALAGAGTVALEEVIATLEAREAALGRETDRLAAARAELEASTEDQRAAREALERRERELGRHARAAIELAVREAREAIRAIVRQAQEAGSARAAEAARLALAETAGAALRQLPVGASTPDGGGVGVVAAARLRVGDEVRVPALGAKGQVVKPPDDRGRLKVTVGKVTVDLHVSELGPDAAGPRGSEAPPGSVRGGATDPSVTRRRPDIRRAEARAAALAGSPAVPSGDGGGAGASGDAMAWAIQNATNTLDLRGRRADDVLDAVDTYLDRAALEDRSPVFIVHGHGTGALKKIVRAHLAASSYVRRWAPGGKGQGGDGVTIVEI